MVVFIIIIVLIIIAIGQYIVNKPKPVYQTVNGVDYKSDDIDITAKPVQYVYNTIYPNGVWSTDSAGSVICPAAQGVNLVGENKDYCIFDNQGDVINYCNFDKDCLGYVHVNDIYQIAKKWGTNTTKNGELVLKQVDVKSML